MREKTPQEHSAAARQVELLAGALNGASSDGYWMNMAGRKPARIYPKGAALSPFNTLILALNADRNGYSTALYTTFTEARKRNESVLKEERSVPMNWYRWASYVNRHDEKNIISREAYLALPAERQELYKGVRQREIRSLFNVEQTTLPMADAGLFEKLRQEYGGITDRGHILAEERELHSSVNRFREAIAQNLAPVRKATVGEASYDSQKDAIYMPDQKHFDDYKDYVQELVRQAVSATGHRERLAREGMVMRGGHAPSEDALRYEQLVSEIASGVKMAEFGLPARLAPKSLPMVEYWTQELKENPCLIDAIEGDVNNALDVIRNAERGERLEFAHTRNRQQTDEWREHERPQVSATEALVFQDIIRQGGMAIDERNFPGGYAQKKEFMEKFDLSYYEGQVLVCLEQARFRQKDPELINIAYTQAALEATRIHRICTEMLPGERDGKASYTIADELQPVPNRKNKEMVVVLDKSTGIADVILPAGARSGGDVALPNGDKRNFWLTPDEVMIQEERKEAGATVINHNTPGMNKGKIEQALRTQGATYVRFFNRDGVLGYRPDDAYFAGKDVYAARLDGKELSVTSRFDVGEAVRRATEVQFDRIQMLKSDDNRWALFLKPVNEPSFSVYPDKEDVNRFFSTVRQEDRVAAGSVRNELAQKYYALASARPDLKADLFGQMPDGIDPLRIKRVNIFRNKEGNYLCAPVIDGLSKVEPREMTAQQWQRVWVAEDVAKYKTALAATLFADLLMQRAEEETTGRQHKEEAAAVHPDVAGNVPFLQGYEELKAKHPDATLLFRTNDRYETYKDDATRVASILGLTATEWKNKSGEPVTVASFPHEKLDAYLQKLVGSGCRVAVCDRLDEPRKLGRRGGGETVPGMSETDKPRQENETHNGIRR